MANTDSTVIITGAASGMGKACTQRFLDEGWHVIAVDKASISANHSAQTVIVADISNEAALTENINEALKSSAPLRAVVNAAGIFPTSSLESYDEALYRRIFDINVLGRLNIARVARSHLRACGGGNIVFFASVDAFAVSNNQLILLSFQSGGSGLNPLISRGISGRKYSS